VSPLPGWSVRPSEQLLYPDAAVFERLADGPAPFPEPEGWTGTEQVWPTPARVMRQTAGAGAAVAADQVIQERVYQITTPRGGPAIRVGERGDVVRALGRRLRVSSETVDSYTLERVFTCLDNLTQDNP